MIDEEVTLWIELSAYAVAAILDILVIILVVIKKRNWSAVNVFIAAFALADAVFLFPWDFDEAFEINTTLQCKMYSFVVESSNFLRFSFLLTTFVVIVKFKKMQLKKAFKVILLELAASSTLIMLLVNHFVDYEEDICGVTWNHNDSKMKNVLIMRSTFQAFSYILTGIILMMNHKQFKLGKSLGFLVAFFISWFPKVLTDFINSADNTSELDYEDIVIIFIIFIWSFVTTLIGIIGKSIFCLIMIETKNEILSNQAETVQFNEKPKELDENRYQ
jgi:hypothetical protein